MSPVSAKPIKSSSMSRMAAGFGVVLKPIWGFFCLLVWPSCRKKCEKAYNDLFLRRQKYVVSRVSDHIGADRNEPAPLLGLTVLDIGCGERSLGEGLVLRGAEVTAIDRDETKLEKAKESAKKFGTPMTFVAAKPEDLVLDPTTFDVVLCMNIFQHVQNIDKLVWMLRKLLKDDGVVVFSVLNRNRSSWIWHILMAEWLLGWRPKGTYQWKRFVEWQELEESLKRHNMELVHHRSIVFDHTIPRWVRTSKVQKGLRTMGAARFKREL